MWLSMALVLAALAAEPVENNLALNPGFESLTEDLPSGWARFLQPQDGAVARSSAQAHSGARAVMVHVPMPYPEDPLNNWSQNIFGVAPGTRMRAQVYARTEAAGEAELWVQCWRKAPLAIAATFRSGEKKKITGTQDWTLAETEFSVPERTDFLTLRCVMHGEGTAWFDDVSLQVLEQEGEAEPASVDAPKPGPAPVAPQAPATPSGVSSDIERLKEANLLLAETVEKLQAECAELRQELEVLRARMDAQAPPTP